MAQVWLEAAVRSEVGPTKIHRARHEVISDPTSSRSRRPQQLRQLGEVHRQSPRLVLGARVVMFLDRPGRREAARGGHTTSEARQPKAVNDGPQRVVSQFEFLRFG